VNAYAAIQTALLHRASTGLGQRVDVALMDCMLNLLVYELQEAQFPAATTRPAYGPIRALDGDLLVAPITPKNFEALCETTGLTKLGADPRFRNVAARAANWPGMMEEVETWTRQHSVDECLSAFESAGVPSARYNDPAAALTNAHLQERNVFTEIKGDAGAFYGVNAPWRLSDADTRLRPDIPEIGEHADMILEEILEMSAEEIQALRAKRALGAKRERA
jgi:crotonobetainyl-CoA:carnitine CoA-transferase CaiB-like acyl-CoA transferase